MGLKFYNKHYKFTGWGMEVEVGGGREQKRGVRGVCIIV